ncbi:MAG: GTP pyrophosphokinase family protein [Clostridia bacterium]|nr:GTP pyrophosphokinase family protein [Clostridia bacterium]MBR4457421.1 GTP pyrophosphokinase family protein [Clostridia bacterium]
MTSLPDSQQQMLQMSGEFQRMVDEFFEVQCRYQAAIRQVRTRLEILDDEYRFRHEANPIHSIQSRMKTIQSMMDKLRRRGQQLSVRSAVENLYDIAGMRVICSYIEDIYTVADALTSQNDIRVIRVRDYIKSPKPNGYRSLHLVLEVPVFLTEGRVTVPVEVQIRTIAMDFWATLEHDLRYKVPVGVPQEISDELQQTAQDITRLDERMQRIHDRVDALIRAQEHRPD